MNELTLGETIFLARKRKKMTCEALCSKAQIHRKTLWRIENGDTNITFDTMLKVLNALDMIIKIETKDSNHVDHVDH